MYKVITPLLKDGERIEAGDTVELNEKDALELVACGAVEAIPEAPAKSNKTKADA